MDHTKTLLKSKRRMRAQLAGLLCLFALHGAAPQGSVRSLNPYDSFVGDAMFRERSAETKRTAPALPIVGPRLLHGEKNLGRCTAAVEAVK